MKTNNKGYTMVELLAIVILLGIFTIIGIASVNGYIISSRKTVYAQMARNFIKEARNQISSKEITGVTNPKKVYYIDIEKLAGDSGKLEPSPFGDWIEGYVIYSPNDNGQDKYYFISLDDKGWMIKRTEESKITKKSVIRDEDVAGLDIDLLGDKDGIDVLYKDTTEKNVTPSKAWTRVQTKKCFSFKDINDKEVELTYYNKACLSEDGEAVIPTKVGGKSVTSIYQYTFYNMGVKSVVLPSTIKTIGHRAFANNKLTTVKIPNSLATVASYAFYNNKLTDVILSDKTTTIAEHAFQYNQLSQPLSVLVPAKNPKIGACAFCNNNIHEGMFLFSGNTVTGYVGDLAEFATDKVFRIPSVTTDGKPVTAIGGSAFYDMSLTNYTVDIPEGITSIGGSAFSFDNISKVNFPNTLKSIGGHAFYSNRITKLEIPSSVTSISSTAFNNNWVPDENGPWIYRRTNTGIDYSTIIGYAGSKKTNVVIPAKAHDVPLKAFGSGALEHLGLSGTLTIPDTVTTYADYFVFANNSFSTIIQGKDKNGNIVSSDGIIYKKNSDGTVDTSYLYVYAGRNKYPVIPSNVVTIGPYAFYYSYIYGVTIPEGVKTIGNYAFYVCQLQGSVTIPSTVESIGTGAFYKMRNWTSMNGDLTKIINKTNIAFNWQNITNGPSAATFVTGTVENWYGDIEVTRE